jgi:hypothetical protein
VFKALYRSFGFFSHTQKLVRLCWGDGDGGGSFVHNLNRTLFFDSDMLLALGLGAGFLGVLVLRLAFVGDLIVT